MTENATHTVAKPKISVRLLPPLIFAAMIFLLLHAPETSGDVRGGLLLFSHTVVPALFPHLVLSDLFVSHMRFSGKAGLVSRCFSRLFRLPPAAAPVILLGGICGFPIGSKISADLYAKDLLSKEDAELLAAYANNTGPAFVIGGAGAALFGDLTLGILFFISEIAASILCLLLTRPKRHAIRKCLQPPSAVKAVDFIGAVKRATLSVLYIGGFIVFFSMVNGTVCRLFPALSLPLSSFFEVTNGIEIASHAFQRTPHTALGFAVFSVGFGGLSAAMQAAFVMKEGGLSFSSYIPRKMLQGFLSVFCFFLLTRLLPF